MNRKYVIFSLVIGFLFILLGAFIWIRTLFLPVSSGERQAQTFIIPKGQAVITIGERLTEAGLIKNPLIFRAVVVQQDLGTKIQAGSFSLSPNMSTVEIAQALTQGTEDVWITLLEGWRAEEMAAYLTKKEELTAFDAQEFIDSAAAYDGTLYPDTYLIPREMTAEPLVLLLVNTFEARMTSKLSDELAATDRDFEDILVMASIVQREARDPEQMRHVAGILWNRIDIGMALQVDATLQYIKGTPSEWWPTPLSADKQLVSAYNTYQNPGLPPGPISNPGLDALRATADPLEVDDLFYIHDPVTGSMYYATTIEEHNQNVNKYLR